MPDLWGMGMAALKMRFALMAAGLFSGLVCSRPASAQDATWLLNPGTADFNTPTNWAPATVPTGTASFGPGLTSTSTLFFDPGTTTVGGFTFNPGSANYAFVTNVSNGLTFTGAGIAINGGIPTFENNGTLIFQNSSTAGAANIINASGGPGDLRFIDRATAGSATIGNAGTLGFFNTSTAGSASIVNSGQITFNQTSTAGSATINNITSVAFNDTSTGGSATISNFGTVSFANTSTAGNAFISNFGQFAFEQTSTAGGATILNHNSLNFVNSTTAGSANITNFADLIFTNTSTAGSATIANNSGVTDFNVGADAGTAHITNANIMDFNQSASANSATIVNSDQLHFNDASTAANATITTTGGTFFAGTSTGGNARLITNSSGIVDISGLTNGGMMAGSIEGAGQYVLGANALTVGSNNLSTTVNGTIVDGGGGTGGSLVKVGTGTLTLSGTNTYTGSTTVNGGALEIDGSIASSSAVLVNSRGTLSGTGTVDPASTQIAGGGTLAPGNAANPTGTLTITGSLAFSSGAFYLVQVSGVNAGNTSVAGSATLAGTVQVAVTGGVQGKTSYDILHAAGGLGGTTFAGVQNLSPGFAGALSYSATDVFLNLTANLDRGVGGGGLGGNQTITTGINNVFNGGGALPPGFLNLFNLTAAQLANALTQISGETVTGAQQTTFNAMGLFMGLLTDPFTNRGGGFGGGLSSSGYAEEALGYASGSKKTDAFAMFTKAPPTFEQRWSVWGAGFGGSQTTDGNTAMGSNNTTSNIAGVAVGADYLFSPNTIAGFALAGGGTNFSVVNGGTGRSDLFQIGAYVRHNQGAAYVSAALAYGWQDITTDRTVTVAGLDHLRAQFNANAWSGRLEGGYRFVSPVTGGIGITPYAAAQFVAFDLPAYTEQAIIGTNAFALAYGAHDATDVRSELGIRVDKSWVTADGLLTLRGRLAWAHDYDPDRAIGATFQTLPGVSFVVNGAAQAADSALTTASIEMRWRNGWSAAATFEGEFSNVTQSYAGKGVVRYAW
jgi:autotransporter-associated beta strand protein